ncbi:MAG: hypothetical protein WC758_07465 [Candidatus Woesearchaeota archaeon]|jgi:hypothetical protein
MKDKSIFDELDDRFDKINLTLKKYEEILLYILQMDKGDTVVLTNLNKNITLKRIK